jgi:DNA polymerase-1
MKKLVLIDAMSVLHRAFHAYPLSLTTKSGEITNAVYGFTAILFSVLEKLQPTHVAVAWDVGHITFRHDLAADYKGKREKPDELLLGQINRTKEVVDALNIPQFGVAGFEADDLIGTLSLQAKEDKESQTIIVTGDRDALQLVDGEKTIVWMPPASGKYGKDRGPMIYDEFAVNAKYKLVPKQIIDLKALMGDQSDNIPGVRGIGPKTADKLFTGFKTVEEIYEAIKTGSGREKIIGLVGERATKLLETSQDSAFLSKKLATIDRQVPIQLDWQKCQLADYDRDQAVALFEELGFKSLIPKLPKDNWEQDLENVFI